MAYCKWICILVLPALQAYANEVSPHKFVVYAFIPWKTNDHHSELIAKRLHAYGMQPIKVIYTKYIFTNNEINPQKLKAIAQASKIQTSIPVSFDLEFGNRFRPETVLPKVQQLLKQYRSFAPGSMTGVYGVLPQNTYSLEQGISTFDKLNVEYKSLINYVDYLSPVLYNYEGNDFRAWVVNAEYTMQAAKKYASNKPIIPYISPIIRLQKINSVRNGTLVEELNEESMAARLQILYDLGASGCIIWASSQDRTKDGLFPKFDPDKAWGRAVVNFIKKH